MPSWAADAGEAFFAPFDVDLVKVFRRAAAGSFPRVAELSAETGDTLATPLLPGFALALAAFFR